MFLPYSLCTQQKFQWIIKCLTVKKRDTDEDSIVWNFTRWKFQWSLSETSTNPTESVVVLSNNAVIGESDV